MNFFQNLAKNIYSGVNKAASAVGNFLTKPLTGTSNVAGVGMLGPTASKVQAAKIDAGLYNPGATGPGITYTPAPPGNGRMTVVPPETRALSMIQNPTGTITSQGLYDAGQIANNAQGGFTPAPLYTPYEVPQSRPSTYNQVTSSGRTSSSDMGETYFEQTDTGLKAITPKVGFMGLSGDGGSGFASLSGQQPSQGQSGSMGLGGFGNLGGINSLGTSGVPMATTQSEEEKIRAEKQKKQTLQQKVQGVTQGLPNAYSPYIAATSGGAGSPTVSGVQVPPGSQLNVKVPTGPINMGALQDTKSILSKLINTPEALTSSDIQALNQNIDATFASAREIIENQSPTPQNPVVDTPEQESFVELSGDPFGARQLLDEFRAQSTNLNQLQTSRFDLIKNIQALNQAYTPILDDIRTNPNLPKALAARRLEQIQTRQKTVLEGFVNQLELINQSIDDQNEVVNRAFNIAKFAQDQNQTAQQNNMAKLKLFIESGAVGAFTDADIRKYSQATGMDEGQLKAIRASAKKPEVSIVTETDASGTVRGIDKNSGKVVWTLPGGGKPQQAPVGTEAQGKLGEFANRLEQSIPIIKNLAPAIQAYDPVKLQAYITAQDFSSVLANKIIPENIKSYLQASRSLINAVLRRESGAVISAEEFANARAQYLPSSGDSDQIVSQTIQNAQINLDNYKRNAGVAYVPFVQTQPVTSSPSQNLSTDQAYQLYLQVVNKK